MSDGIAAELLTAVAEGHEVNGDLIVALASAVMSDVRVALALRSAQSWAACARPRDRARED